MHLIIWYVHWCIQCFILYHNTCFLQQMTCIFVLKVMNSNLWHPNYIFSILFTFLFFFFPLLFLNNNYHIRIVPHLVNRTPCCRWNIAKIVVKHVSINLVNRSVYTPFISSFYVSINLFSYKIITHICCKLINHYHYRSLTF